MKPEHSATDYTSNPICIRCDDVGHMPRDTPINIGHEPTRKKERFCLKSLICTAVFQVGKSI
jgi:hypothetical protein